MSAKREYKGFEKYPLSSFKLGDTEYQVGLNGMLRRKSKLDKKARKAARKAAKEAKCEVVEFLQMQSDGTLKKDLEVLLKYPNGKTLVLNK